ncbi:MAG: 4'-phosphopantetheinyl transferase superfamily protein [Geitlerinemataceae cyanobacterium]
MRISPSCFNFNDELDANTVWVWQANLELPESETSELEAILSTDEKERADRFHRDSDRSAFMAARGILRTLLGRYLKCAPHQVQFSYSDRGKPFIADSSLHFNVSHSGGLALYAIAYNRLVGIDVESIRSIEVEQLAKRFFCDREYQQLCQLSDARKDSAFFIYWTAKEAYLKATGEGLIGLQQVEIFWEGDNLWTYPSPPEDSPRFSLQRLHPPSGYAAALAVEGKDWQLSYQALT